MRSIYGNSIQMLNKSLDYLWARTETISHNISNVDTVGFKAQYVTFEEAFKSKLEGAIASGKSANVQNAIATTNQKVNTSNSQGLRLDGNNVNLDVEIAELTRTTLQYQYGTSAIDSDISRLRAAIKGQ